MDKDSIERDRLLTEVATNVQYLVEGHKNTIQALVDHAHVDDTRFGCIDKTLDDIKKFKWQSTGVVVAAVFIINLAIALFHK